MFPFLDVSEAGAGIIVLRVGDRVVLLLVGDVAAAVALFAVNEAVARVDRVAIGYLSVAVALSAVLRDFESSHFLEFLRR